MKFDYMIFRHSVTYFKLYWFLLSNNFRITRATFHINLTCYGTFLVLFFLNTQCY